MLAKALETADALMDVASLAGQITQKPNPFQAGLIGLSLIRAGMNIRRIWSVRPRWTDVFHGNWVTVDSAPRALLLPCLGAEARLVSVIDGMAAWWDVDGAQFVLWWAGDRRDEGTLWMDTSRWEATAAFLARCYQAAHSAPLYVWTDGKFEAEAPLPDLVEPEQLQPLLTRMRGFFDARKHRSYMLTGAPGAGKGVLALLIARAVNSTLVSIDAANLRDTNGFNAAGHDLSNPVAVVGVWRPGVVVVNDIDYLPEDEQLDVLNCLERLHRAAPLLLVTVNHPENLCAAAKRPGRVDEAFVVRGAGAREVAALLPTCTETRRASVLGWPIAYVAELAARLRQYGDDHFDHEYAQLALRVSAQEAAEGGDDAAGE